SARRQWAPIDPDHAQVAFGSARTASTGVREPVDPRSVRELEAALDDVGIELIRLDRGVRVPHVEGALHRQRGAGTRGRLAIALIEGAGVADLGPSKKLQLRGSGHLRLKVDGHRSR